MGYINLFKINSDDKLFQEFRTLLNGLPQIGKPKTLPSPNLKKDYKLSFYAMPSQNDSSNSKELSWRWVYDEFKSVAPRPSPYPRDVLVIQDLSNQNCYCVTFGNSFFKIDRYCDRDFGFNFARKIDIKETRTCTKSSPGLKRNKTVNTYVKFEGLDHDSSEAYSKLKILVPKQPDFNLFQPTVSIGQSIRFNVGSKNDSLNTVLQLIEYVEKTLTLEDKNKIPIFRLIKDKDLIDKLDSFLIQKIITDDVAILNPELEIYGSTEVLNNADQRFLLVTTTN